ncbi:carboxypeptidase A2-like [Contarinia nasturtii]|uniref:carboxypeptidase A2-like n=1 Tax=Contarinia nasturtii TaxID=265458 RepID=UPI0012D3E504|nr:carboxypeptidase A2-like [Contarinia nasturtii]
MFNTVLVVLFIAENLMHVCECVPTKQKLLQSSLRKLSSGSGDFNPANKDEELITAAAIGNAYLLSKLIEKGANISACDHHGMTALHWAAENGQYDAAKFLIESGADVNVQDLFFNTPLHIASSNDNPRMMKMLIKHGARLSIKNLANYTPIKMCTVKDQLSPILSEINAKGLKLLDAIKKGQMNIFNKLISEGVDIDLEYYENQEAKTPLYEAISLGKNYFVTFLEFSGADVSGTTPSGMTLREFAALKSISFLSNSKNVALKIVREQKYVHEWLQENPPQKEIEKQQRQNGHALTWQAYHRFDDIYAFLKHLAKKYPKLCKVSNIGQTPEGRPLVLLRISNGKAANKAIWIDGGIHASEWVSPAAVTYIANDLVLNWNKQPEHVKNINWHIVAVLNPDGYEFSHQNGNRFWRKNRNSKGGNCVGVDLTRNFGYNWNGHGSTLTNECNENYGGPRPFSEPETEAVQGFFNRTVEKFCAFLTFRSFGRYITYPTGCRMSMSHGETLKRVGEEGVKQMNALKNQSYIVSSVSKPATGSPDDWARSIGIKYTYTIKLRDMGRYGYLLPVGQILPTALEAQAFLRSVSKAIFEDLKSGKL